MNILQGKGARGLYSCILIFLIYENRCVIQKQTNSQQKIQSHVHHHMYNQEKSLEGEIQLMGEHLKGTEIQYIMFVGSKNGLEQPPPPPVHPCRGLFVVVAVLAPVASSLPSMSFC